MPVRSLAGLGFPSQTTTTTTEVVCCKKLHYSGRTSTSATKSIVGTLFNQIFRACCTSSLPVHIPFHRDLILSCPDRAGHHQSSKRTEQLLTSVHFHMCMYRTVTTQPPTRSIIRVSKRNEAPAICEQQEKRFVFYTFPEYNHFFTGRTSFWLPPRSTSFSMRLTGDCAAAGQLSDGISWWTLESTGIHVWEYGRRRSKRFAKYVCTTMTMSRRRCTSTCA